MKEPHPPAPSPKRRGGERRSGNPTPRPLPETERGRKKECSVFLPLSVSGRGLGGGVLSQPLREDATRQPSIGFPRAAWAARLSARRREDRAVRRTPAPFRRDGRSFSSRRGDYFPGGGVRSARCGWTRQARRSSAGRRPLRSPRRSPRLPGSTSVINASRRTGRPAQSKALISVGCPRQSQRNCAR